VAKISLEKPIASDKPSQPYLDPPFQIKPRWSATLAALILFAGISTCVFFIAQLCIDNKYKFCQNLIISFTNAKPKPDVVLVGSSLMRQPFYWLDLKNQTWLDPQYYCGSRTLQNILNRNRLNPQSVFNFSINGSMVSDVYLVHQKFFMGKNAPKWIVYGIAPRDLFDNLLSKETRTIVFDYLFDLKDIWLSKSLFNLDLSEKIDLTLEKLCPTYGYRGMTQQWLLGECRQASDDALLEKQKGKNLLIPQKAALAGSFLRYKKRFKVFESEKFEKQKLFLNALCEESRAQGTNVLLVNMPLTKTVANLIPHRAYDYYNKTIAGMAKLPGVVVLDLHDSNQFSNECFYDLVHLNGQGGYILSRLIVDILLGSDHKQPNSARLSTVTHNDDIIDGLASWWLAKAYFAKPKAPEVVVLGGSQLGPVAGADSYVYNRTVDLTGDHRSYSIEHDLRVILHKNWHVLIGVLPGGMISDFLVASRAMFRKHYKPKFVAIALSPKEFIDSRYRSAKNTETFFTFSHGKSLPGCLEKMRHQSCNYRPTDDNFSNDHCPLHLSNPFERVYPGEIAITSGDGYVFTDDAKNYSIIYKNPMSSQLTTQLDYLDALFKYLKQEQIQTIAIELPLSNVNHILLPETFWHFYKTRVKQICQKYNVDYLDTDTIWDDFPLSEFCDSAHLGLRGGLKLSRAIVLGTSYKFHLPIYAYNGNFGPLVPGKEKIYLHKTWSRISK